MAQREYYIRDIFGVIVIALIAILFWRTGLFEAALRAAERVPFMASFVAGMFFTSFFTVIPATAVIGELALQGTPLARLALVGGLGAMFADLIIFLLLREGIAEPLLQLIHSGSGKKMRLFVQRGKHRLAGTLLGAIFIASPLPDELGLLLMGLAKARWYTTMAITYLLNSAGIAAVALLARSL